MTVRPGPCRHPGYVKVEVLTYQWQPGVVYELTPKRRGGFRSRVWTIARCVRCGEAEVAA